MVKYINFKVNLIIWIIAGFVLSAQVKLFADITGSAHDFSGVSMTGSKGEMCRVCHVPHKGRSIEAPLWRANLSSPVITYNLYSSNTLEAAVNQPAASTKACLSCHDGSTARSPANGCTACHQNNQLGIDLANDHPVSFVYDGALAAADGGLRNPSVDIISGGGSLNGKFIKDGMLIGDKLECSSCHDVHAKKGDSATAPHLLLIDNKQDKLCLTCHNK